MNKFEVLQVGFSAVGRYQLDVCVIKRVSQLILQVKVLELSMSFLYDGRTILHHFN